MGRPNTFKHQLFDLWYHQDYYDRHYHPDPVSGCWLWNGPSHRQGYGMIGAWRDPDMHKIMTTCHRIMARRKLGRAIDSSEWVIHTCGEPRCVNPDHLAVGSRQDLHDLLRSQGRRPWGRGRPRQQKSP